MIRRQVLAGALALAVGGTVLAKLPAPTPEEQQAAAAKKEAEAARAKQEQEALSRAQDRVVEHYKRTKAAAGQGQPAAGPTQAENLPRPAVEPPGTAGPRGGREQSAEAHSAQAK